MLWHLTTRNLRAQYKQSVLGYAWLVINPLAQLGTLAFIFSLVFDSPSEGTPFILFLAMGLFPWIFFSNAVGQATDSLVESSGLITSVYFPRQLLIVSAVLIRTVDFGVGLVILAVAILLAGESLTWSALWLLPLFCLHLLFVVGLAMPLAALNLFFHDVRFLVGVVLNLWFFFTPIFYSVELVPSSYRFLYDLNPMARFVGAYREAVLLHGSPPAASLLIATLATLGVLTLGSYVFRKLEPRFADRI